MEQQLRRGLQEMGFHPSDLQINQFMQFYHLLVEWNNKMNLTSITTPEEVVTHHFLDSVSCASTAYFEECLQVLDMGTGAGFPGIPLKIMYPEKTFTLMDSLAKRINFLKVVTDTLGLEKVKLIHARAEEAARDLAYREFFDGVVSRAVAPLPVLFEYTIPFIRTGGWLICQKGPKGQDELQDAQDAMKLLAVSLVEIVPVNIPGTDLNHQVMVFRKEQKTHDKYPRKAGTPGRKPL